MKIILEKISDEIDLSSLSQEERDRYIVERTDRGIDLVQAGAVPSDVVTFLLTNYIKLNWRGVWGSENTYKYNDAVSHLGSSYVALRATSEEPGETAVDWNLLAKKGANGNTPYIGENGNWWINGVDTGTKAEGVDGVGISNWELVSTVCKVKTYRITFTDSSTFEYTITDGTDGRGIVSFDLIDTQEKTKTYRLLYTDATYVDIDIIDGNDGADGATPYIGLNGNWWIRDFDQNVKAEGVDGVSPTIGLNGNWYLGTIDTGVKAEGVDGTNGTDGVGISNIEKTGTLGNVDEYTITFSDASTFLFYVTNGVDGADGQNGTNGSDGMGIVSIIKTSTLGLVDTYTITYTDTTTSTFNVTNGANGTNGTNGVDGQDGADGADGKSAYQSALDGGYTGTESEFNELFNSIDSHIADNDIHIDSTSEFSGSIDETSDKFTIWDNSLLKWIRFSFTNLKSYLKTYFDGIYSATGHNHTGTYEPVNSNIQSHIGNGDIHVTTTDKSNWNGKQYALGFTPENVANKENTTIDTSTTKYPTVNLLKSGLDTKQPINLKFTDTSASSWVSDTTYTNYGYKCELTLSGIASTDIAEVTFGHTEAISGNYSPVCLTSSNKVTIYSKVNTSITIPTILINKQS